MNHIQANVLFPLATVSVFYANSTTLAPIFADNNQTPLTNPFTADSTGNWSFFARPGSYDIEFSGTGIATPFFIKGLGNTGVPAYTQGTLPPANASNQGSLAVVTDAGGLWLDTGTQWTPVSPFINVKDHGVKGDGVTDDTAAIANAWAQVTPNGGILFFPIGTYKTTGTLTARSGSIIQGSGTSSTLIAYSGPGYWIDLGPTVSVTFFSLRDLQVNCASPSIGALRVGSVNEDYGNAVLRNGWNISNVYFLGPGGAVAGTIGMSVSLLIDHAVSNLTVSGFERIAIIDRCLNGTWTRARFTVFTYGPLLTNKAGTGSITPGGGSGDTFIDPEFLGPTAGNVGDTVTVVAGGITFINALYEGETGGVSQALLHITNSAPGTGGGAFFKDIGGDFSFAASSAAATMVFDNYASPMFIGTIVGISSFPPIHFNTISPPGTGDFSAKFVNCSLYLNQLVRAADNTGAKASIFHGEADTFPGYAITQTQNHDQTGGFRVVGTNGFNRPGATGGVGIELFYLDPVAVDQGYIECINRTTNTQKPLNIVSGYLSLQVAGTTACAFNGASMQVAGGVQPFASSPGMQHLRIVTAPLPGSGAISNVQLNWSVAFANASYTAVCTVLEATAGDTIRVLKIVQQTAAGILVSLINNSTGSLTATLYAIAMHD